MINKEIIKRYASHIGDIVRHPEHGEWVIDGVHSGGVFVLREANGGKEVMEYSLNAPLVISNKSDHELNEDMRVMAARVHNMTWEQFRTYSRKRQGVMPVTRSFHVVFLRKCLGWNMKRAMAEYSLDHSTYYNCERIVRDIMDTKDPVEHYYREILDLMNEVNPHWEDDIKTV